MLRSIFICLALTLSQPAHAAISPEDLRDMAYAGDVHGAETALAEAHAQSLSGEISYDALRDIVTALLTSHPDVNAFSADWIAAYPASPYAKSVRAFQMNNAAWDMRGDKFVHQTHPDALYAFGHIRAQAQDLAKEAYEAAPDFVPASDAVLMLELGQRSLSDDRHRKLTRDILALTPNSGTLGRALYISRRNWGGRGFGLVSQYCYLFAGQIVEFDDFTPEVCTAYMVGWLNMYDDNARAHAIDVLENTDHPALGRIRLWRAFERRSDADRRELLDWFQEPDNHDYYYAHLFQRSFRNDSESAAIFKDMDARIQAYAQAALPDNPFSPSLIHILARDYDPIRGSGTFAYDGKLQANLAQRLSVSKPYDSAVWLDVALFVGRPFYLGEGAAHAQAAHNAIYYDPHNHLPYDRYLTDLSLTYRDYREAQDMGWELSAPMMTPHQIDRVVLCEAMRVLRFIAVLDENLPASHDPAERPANNPEVHDMIAEVERRDICHKQRFDALETLWYTPTFAIPDDVAPDMANR